MTPPVHSSYEWREPHRCSCGEQFDTFAQWQAHGASVAQAAQPQEVPASPKEFRDGVRSLRLLVRDEMDKPDHVMPHTHNPDVQPEHQGEYCWRCKIERVLDSNIEGYAVHCLPASQSRDRAIRAEAVEDYKNSISENLGRNVSLEVSKAQLEKIEEFGLLLADAEIECGKRHRAAFKWLSKERGILIEEIEHAQPASAAKPSHPKMGCSSATPESVKTK